MNRLNRDARALLERGRPLHEPSARDRATVRRALALELPAAALATTLLSQTAPAAAGGVASGVRTALVIKWVTGGVLIGSLSAGALEVGSRALETPSATVQQPDTPRPSRRRAAVDRTPKRAPDAAVAPPAAAHIVDGADAPAPNAALRAVPIPLTTSRRRAAESSERAKPPSRVTPEGTAVMPDASGPRALTAEPTSSDAPSSDAMQMDGDADQLLAEARALREAQTALREGDATRALELIRQQSRRFSKGALNEERHAVRLLARCALGSASASEVARFLERSGTSPLAARVRNACIRR